jgi:hypothetical protein
MFDKSAYIKAYSKARRERLKAEGRCQGCQRLLPASEKGKTLCKTCRDSISASRKAKYIQTIEHRLCPKCKAPVGDDYHAYCKNCREKMRTREMTEKEKAYRRAYARAYYAKEREERKKTREEGKCPRCKAVLVGRDRAFVYCEKCRQANYLGVRK